MLLPLLKVSVVAAPIFVRQLALALEQVLREAAFVGALRLRKVVDPLPLEHAIDKIALVEAPIGPLVAPTAILFPLVVLALETDLALLPCLSPHAVLVIIHPFTVIGGSLRVDESAAAIRHAIFPLALVNAAIGLDHASEPLHLIRNELALILRAVWPDQDAKAILNWSSLNESPLALVLFWHVLTVNGVDKGAVDVALGRVEVDLFHLGVAEKRWPTFNAMLSRFS